MRCHFLLQGIFPTQGLNPGPPHCKQMLYCLSQQDLGGGGRKWCHLISCRSVRGNIHALRNPVKLQASIQPELLP